MKVVPQIRGTHPYSFRSGKWGTITGVELVSSREWSGLRPCFKVVFPDGETDSWAIYDSGYDYEFCNTTVLEPADFEVLYINLNIDNTASVVVRYVATGKVIEIPGGPITVVEE